jgi:3-hydroxyacyl-[acyl-carrier-protein] dehydratase
MSAKQTPLFDYNEIASLLPHRYPFQFIDRVLEFEDGRRIVALKNVSINEPFFRGHFPEYPLMPGVLICEALAQAGALLGHRSTNGVRPGHVFLLAGLDRVRFRHLVRPGDQLYLEVVVLRRHWPLWKMHGVARVEGRAVTEADLSAVEIERSWRP